MKLRFSFRDLLWLTVVVALTIAWWLDYARLKEQGADKFGVEFNGGPKYFDRQKM